ncbi:HNH endonuclease [Anaerovibrio sp. JC8]|uniref:HNH endonuclease n=1 Tax=Anaerovibrio sp. JC8 TaxID=1240085 RepID=UPI000A0E4A22|nr:HNH endonuclease [Anaerovibrio sp. JC8]ORT99400.1 HNH endonuclease [Anaerovibrio sp. JC8]
MASAKDKLHDYFLQHVGEIIDRETLRNVAGNIQDWQRSLRQLRQETGLDIVSQKEGYILTSATPVNTPQIRKPIDDKLRYAVLQRDNSTCQRCGANIHNKPNVSLAVDHKLPVDMGGDTTIDNLWTLCSDCNGGKKAFFKDDKTDEIKEIMQLSSASKRLKAYFELYPNKVIEPIKLSVIANVRDWERALRLTRQQEGMDIQWIRPCTEYPMGGYIYHY